MAGKSVHHGVLGFQAMEYRSRRVFGVILGLVVLLGISARPVAAFTVGMVADDSTNPGTATIFNADTDTILGSVSIANPSGFFGDCQISADRRTGYFTNFGSVITQIDLTTTPPSIRTRVKSHPDLELR